MRPPREERTKGAAEEVGGICHAPGGDKSRKEKFDFSFRTATAGVVRVVLSDALA